jgi:hypothetical protein
VGVHGSLKSFFLQPLLKQTLARAKIILASAWRRLWVLMNAHMLYLK